MQKFFTVVIKSLTLYWFGLKLDLACVHHSRRIKVLGDVEPAHLRVEGYTLIVLGDFLRAAEFVNYSRSRIPGFDDAHANRVQDSFLIELEVSHLFQAMN